MAEVALRRDEDSDLDTLFEQTRGPESVQMAAFTAEDPNDRAAFDSLRVLRKAGFTFTGTEISYAPARGVDIEETILRLG